MYDTTSRTVITTTQTGKDVGPSTYVICSPRCKKRNCVPFLSSQAKTPSFITKFNTDAIYDTRTCTDKIRGGSSLRNKAPRFVYRANDTPAPTRYETGSKREVRKKLQLDPAKPKLYQCRVPYTLTVIAPSIPTKVDENGYELDTDGNIVKVAPDEEVPTELDIKSTFCGKKGSRWACRTSERFDPKQYKTNGPGPAAYFREVPRCRRAEEDEKFREMARLFSFVPRYIEAQEMKAAREALPGPGSYNIPSTTTDLTKSRSKSIRPKPFIRASRRFSETLSETPSPAAYNVCDCSRLHRQFSTKCAPFGFDSPRFGTKKVECSPGPGDYELKAPLQEKIEKKSNPFALCDPPFNSTAERKIGFVARDAPCMPSPAEYPEDKERGDDTTGISSSVFMNIVCRFYSPSDKKDFIGPARYDVGESFDKNRRRKCFSVSEVPFNTSGPRSATPTARLDVPCPTSYKNEFGLSCRGYHFSMSRRFGCPKDSPGPGAYNIHPRIEKSTYKAMDTHNLRLKENVLRKKLRTVSRETRKRWLAQLKKKKLLNWFNVELDFEERMMILIQQLFDEPN